jgi:hypothetical protein
MDLMRKVRRATSPDVRFQLTTDGLKAYVAAVDEFLMDRCDYAQIIKTYAEPQTDERRYSPAEYAGSVKTLTSGNPMKIASALRTWSGRTSRCGCRSVASLG